MSAYLNSEFFKSVLVEVFEIDEKKVNKVINYFKGSAVYFKSLENEEIVKTYINLTEQMSHKEAVKKIANDFNKSRKAVYNILKREGLIENKRHKKY